MSSIQRSGYLTHVPPQDVNNYTVQMCNHSSHNVLAQVVADHMRGGQVSMMGSGFIMPARFSCWASLAVSQVLVPQASLTGHLCGVIAGLAHVYIPKAGIASSFVNPSKNSLTLLPLPSVDMFTDAIPDADCYALVDDASYLVPHANT